MNSYLSFSRRLLATGVLVCAAFPACAQDVPNPATLLQALDLGGQTETTTWTNLSNSNASYVASGKNATVWRAAGAYLAPSSGAGTLSVIPGGYPATVGIYSFSDDLGIVTSASAGFDISNVVLQVAKIANPDFYNPSTGRGSPADALFFNYRDHNTAVTGHADYLPGDAHHNTALWALSEGVADYAGGPVLTYVVDGVSYIYQGTPEAAFLGEGVYSNAYQGTFYDFAWQWDLSFVEGTVTSVSIALPVIVHESVIGAQLTLGDGYHGSAIPEPATYAVLFGGLAMGLALARRVRAMRSLG